MKHYLLPITILSATLLVSACATHVLAPDTFDRAVYAASHESDGEKILGRQIEIGGIWYQQDQAATYTAFGLASWYGIEATGRRTANGEITDPQSLLAAHPTLPLPSYADVENLETGSHITVRVNDRGQFGPGHIITLSQRAAEVLGINRFRKTKVRVRYLAPAPFVHLGDKL